MRRLARGDTSDVGADWSIPVCDCRQRDFWRGQGVEDRACGQDDARFSGAGDLVAVQNSVCLFQDALSQLGDVKDEWDVLVLLNTCESMVASVVICSDVGGSGSEAT